MRINKNILVSILTMLFFACCSLYYWYEPRKVDWFFGTVVCMCITAFVVYIYSQKFPGALDQKGKVRLRDESERCYHCGNNISIFRRMLPHDYESVGGNDYCSTLCRRRSIEEINKFAEQRLLDFVRPQMEPSTPFFVDGRTGNVLKRPVDGKGIPHASDYTKLPGTHRDPWRKN